MRIFVEMCFTSGQSYSDITLSGSLNDPFYCGFYTSPERAKYLQRWLQATSVRNLEGGQMLRIGNDLYFNSRIVMSAMALSSIVQCFAVGCSVRNILSVDDATHSVSSQRDDL